MLFNIIN